MWRLEHARARPRDCAKDYCGGACVAEEPADRSELEELHAAFWAEQDGLPIWRVPLSSDPAATPWISPGESGLAEACSRARTLRGRTPLLIDNTRDHVVDTFHAYRLCQVVEIKQAILQVHTGERTREEVLEKWRLQLVNAMRYGQVLYVRCANCNPTSLADRLTGDSTPALCDHATLSTRRVHAAARQRNLHGSSHPFARAARLGRRGSSGVFQLRLGFDVVVSTHLDADDACATLAGSLPMARQPMRRTARAPLPSEEAPPTSRRKRRLSRRTLGRSARRGKRLRERAERCARRARHVQDDLHLDLPCHAPNPIQSGSGRSIQRAAQSRSSSVGAPRAYCGSPGSSATEISLRSVVSRARRCVVARPAAACAGPAARPPRPPHQQQEGEAARAAAGGTVVSSRRALGLQQAAGSPRR